MGYQGLLLQHFICKTEFITVFSLEELSVLETSTADNANKAKDRSLEHT